MRKIGTEVDKLPSEVAERLGPFYVYALIDPRTNKIFYIGKGTGKRLLDHGHQAHLKALSKSESKKISTIKDIRSLGKEPIIDIIHHGLDEKEALLVEASLIDSIENLTNIVRGHVGSKGRASLNELISKYGSQPVSSNASPAILIRLGKWKNEKTMIESGIYRNGHGYREGITLNELIDSTRAWWKINPNRIKREQIKYAVGVYDGVTRVVMEIVDWTRRSDGRWAFTTVPITDGDVFDEWIGSLGKRVEFMRGIQNPIIYWPINR